jgi:hypothetical protein
VQFTDYENKKETTQKKILLLRMKILQALRTSIMGITAGKHFSPPVVMGTEDIMSQKAHGTSMTPVQQNLKWNVDVKNADKICNFNRHYAEHSGYFKTVPFLNSEDAEKAKNGQEITFYDSNTGKPLFYAPRNRTWEEFVTESSHHGWPSFRDAEVEWENVRVLPDGETVSVDGTHLGHNLPSSDGRNRYCINLISVAGRPV